MLEIWLCLQGADRKNKYDSRLRNAYKPQRKIKNHSRNSKLKRGARAVLSLNRDDTIMVIMVRLPGFGGQLLLQKVLPPQVHTTRAKP